MLRSVLLVFAVAGLHARPLQNDALQFQNGGWVIRAPPFVQNNPSHSVHQNVDKTLSRHVQMNKNNGLLKEHSTKMGQHVGEPEVDHIPVNEVHGKVNQDAIPTEGHRQGTEPSKRFLMDLNTGMLKEQISEMDRRIAGFYNYPSSLEFRQGTENSQATLVDIKTGHLLAPLSEMQRRTATKGQRNAAEDTMGSKKAVPLEFRRQGTEPSRRFLVDLNTGMLREHMREMDRRVSGFYNPASNYEFRQGTENSQQILVDIHTGLQLNQISEMQRRAGPVNEFKQGTEYSLAILMELRKAKVLKDMERNTFSKDETEVKGVSLETVPAELYRQGTEPSRRFLMDLNIWTLNEHLSEMNRRVAGFYDYPSNNEFRQGTENSQATLVDKKSGQILAPLSEMQRRTALLSEQGSKYSQGILKELQNNHIGKNIELNEDVFEQAQQPKTHQALEHNEVDIYDLGEIRHGMEFSHTNIIDNRAVKPAQIKKVEEVTVCHGDIIDGRCHYFNPNLLTFSEAEASCKLLSPLGHLVSVTSADLHAHVVAMVTKSSRDRDFTWLGGTMKNNQFEWIDGSSWGYSDWMPGHPRTEKYKQLCVEMSIINKSWAAVDCGMKRTSVCSFPVTA